MTRLNDLLEQLRLTPIRVGQYQDLLGDVAFELATADTFIAGIATELLERRRPSHAAMPILQRPLLERAAWVMSTGQNVDLSDQLELLRAAELLEQLRRECLAAVMS